MKRLATALLISHLAACKGGASDVSNNDAARANYCSDEIPCENPNLPFCDLTGVYPDSNNTPNTCIVEPPQPECSDTTPCADAQRPVCNSIGECVECSNFSHCNSTNPLCSLSTYTCGPCRFGDEGDTVCEAIDSFRPFCAKSGSCAECLDNSACNIISAPICDASDFVCRGCTDSGECDIGACNTITGVCESD